MKEYEREEKEMQWGNGKGRKEQRMEKREREGKRIGKERKGKGFQFIGNFLQNM